MLPLRVYAVSLASLLAGAAAVHIAYQPDTRLPVAAVAAAKGVNLSQGRAQPVSR
jgi:hypothetical protein